MAGRPEISVIIPARDAERYVDAALRSVEAQAVPCQTIVVDDGSADRTAEILRGWEDRITLITQETRGPAAARNRGLSAAVGRFVAFLDADDLWPEGKLARQLPVLRASPGIDAICGFTGWFVGDPRSARPVPHLTLTLGSAVFRREALDALRGFDETAGGDCEDVDLFLRAREAGLRIHVLDEITALYRRHEGGMTFGKRPGEGNLLPTLKRSLDRRRAFAVSLRPLSRSETRVSVIIPVFDGEAFVGEAIESALSQSHEPFETIVVDDGSRDGTRQVCERFGRRIRYVRRKRSGPAAARNLGMREARGDAFCFLDADDLLTSDSISAGVAALQGPRLPDIVFGLTEYRRMSGERLGEARFYNLGSALFRRAVFERVGAFDPARRSCEDIDLFLRARETGLRMVTVEKPLVVRRKRPGSMSYGVSIEDSGFLVEIKRSLDRRRERGGTLELRSLLAG